MLTAIRIDTDLKNRINSLPLLSQNVKSFSHSLRYLLDLGLQTFDQSLGLINEGTEKDIRFIAQKHDLGERLSEGEMTFLLVSAASPLLSRSFLHLETMTVLTDVFLSFVKSRCYAPADTVIHLFKKFDLGSLPSEEFDPLRFGGPLSQRQMSSHDFYERMDEVENAFKSKLGADPCPVTNPLFIAPLRDFMCFLTSILYDKGANILSPLAFQQVLQPYLTTLIQIAKYNSYQEKEAARECPPYHTVSQKLFAHQQGLEKPLSVESKSYTCHLWAHDLKKVFTTFVFNQKDATLSLDFPAFDDLLEMAHAINRFSSARLKSKEKQILRFDAPGLSFVWNSDETKNGMSVLMAQQSSFMFDHEEVQDFITFLLTIEDKFKEQLKALRYQLGSV